ncbi:MAG: DUF2752 domain-containing protein [Chitinophagaceae bacterium]
MFILAIFTDFVYWLEANMLSCPSKKYLYIECPGCGLQRSFLALLKGDLMNSFLLYPATIPILAMIGFTALHLKCKFKTGATIILYLQMSIAIIMAVFYIYKILNHQIADYGKPYA